MTAQFFKRRDVFTLTQNWSRKSQILVFRLRVDVYFLFAYYIVSRRENLISKKAILLFTSEIGRNFFPCLKSRSRLFYTFDVRLTFLVFASVWKPLSMISHSVRGKKTFRQRNLIFHHNIIEWMQNSLIVFNNYRQLCFPGNIVTSVGITVGLLLAWACSWTVS